MVMSTGGVVSSVSIATVPQAQGALIGAINTACSIMAAEPSSFECSNRRGSVETALYWLQALGFGAGTEVGTLRGEGTHAAVREWVDKFGINPEQAVPTPRLEPGDKNYVRFGDLPVVLHRTFRLPDNDKIYDLPASLGHFPLLDITSLDPARTPADWAKTGGLATYLYPWEATWLGFGDNNDTLLDFEYVNRTGIPYAMMIAAGMINAATGEPWEDNLGRGKEQDYVVAPHPQQWLDGFSVGKGKDAQGLIGQFVAAQLGLGATVEAQKTGQEKFGGFQFLVAPMKADEIVKHKRADIAALVQELQRPFRKAELDAPHLRRACFAGAATAMPASLGDGDGEEKIGFLCASATMDGIEEAGAESCFALTGAPAALAAGLPERTSGVKSKAAAKIREMGFAAGGLMRQAIEEDPFGRDAWAWDASSRLFIHTVHAMDWEALTGQKPGPTPVTRQTYEAHGIPWFHLKALMAANADALGGVQSIARWARAHGFDVDAKDFEAPVRTEGAPLVTYAHQGEKGKGGLAVESVKKPSEKAKGPPPPPKIPGAVGAGKVSRWKRLLGRRATH